MLATTNIYLADWMSRSIERHVGYTGGASLFYIILLMLFVSQAAANVRAFRLLSRLLTWTAAFQFALIVGIFAILASIAWPGAYPFQIMAYTSSSWIPVEPAAGGTSMLLGFLLLQRLFLGIGDGAQAGEETSDPRITLPWSIYLSAAGLAFFGFILFAFIVMHARIGDFGLTAMPALGDWLTDVWERWGDAGASLFFVLVAVLVWANGTLTMGAGARTLFAMARDEVIPFASKLSAVSVLYRSPMQALLTIAAGAGAIALLSSAIYSSAMVQSLLPQLILLSIAALHAAYAIPIGGRVLLTLKERKDNHPLRPANRKRSKLHGPWNLGKYSLTVDGITVCWLTGSAVLAVCLLKPAALIIASVCLIAGTACMERMLRRLRRKTPVKIVGSIRFGKRTMDECIRIERKFPQ